GNDDDSSMSVNLICRRAANREELMDVQAHPISILIIEDIADSRNLLRRLLSLDGHRVRVAADGHEGLAALTAQPPDVALIDVGLPGINGYELARTARKNPATS